MGRSMKILLLMILTSPLYAQNLTPEEQKNLIEENKFLKEEILKAKETPQDSAKIMETLKKGQRFQEDQAKALEELDKED